MDKVVPISLELGTDFSSLIITGPNTGGKTVSLKTIGLLSAMACSGLNIPADEHSSIYVFDHIFADIGDEQSITESLSTFSSHISNIVKITQTATSDSLILVDELGSGTDPLEGAHLAISILQYFTELGCLTVATSHYQELKKYALVTPGFKNASVEFDIENLKPTYRLLIGIPGKSNAFAISRKLGLNEAIIEHASSMIDKETVTLEDLLKNIYDEKSKIEDEKRRTSIALAEAEELRKSLKNQHFDVSSKEKELIANAKQEAKQILLDAKETANSIIRDMDHTNSASKANKLRNKLNDEISSLSGSGIGLGAVGFGNAGVGTAGVAGDNGLNAGDIELPDNLLPPIKREDIKPGLNVYVNNLGSDGVVVSNISKDNTVQVQVGIMKMKVNIKNLYEAKSGNSSCTARPNNSTNLSNSANSANQARGKVSIGSTGKVLGGASFKAQTVKPEINVLGLTVDEAVPIIDKYIDDCFMAKLSPIRIVHGKGTGALRKGIQRYLKTNKFVDSFRPGTFGEGEMGVTVVSLKIK